MKLFDRTAQAWALSVAVVAVYAWLVIVILFSGGTDATKPQQSINCTGFVPQCQQPTSHTRSNTT